MEKNADIMAQAFTDAVAAMFSVCDNEVFRFTPSIMYGRRYLGIKIDEYTYMLQVDVSAVDDERR